MVSEARAFSRELQMLVSFLCAGYLWKGALGISYARKMITLGEYFIFLGKLSLYQTVLGLLKSKDFPKAFPQ